MSQTLVEQEQLPQSETIAGELFRLTWPIAFSMLSYSLMTAVDTLFVGRCGPSAISAVGVGGLYSFTLLTFAIGLLRGGKVIVAQVLGAGRTGEVSDLAAATLGAALLGSVVTCVVTFASIPLLSGVFGEAKANDELIGYVSTRAYAIPLVLLAAALREVSQGKGDSRGPMWAALSANLLNIPFNAWFVIGLGGGVTGSAWANVLAQAIDLVVLGWLRRDWVLALRTVSLRRVRHILKTGWPLGAEMLLDCSAFTLLGFILARLGTIEMAAHQIALQVCHLTVLPLLALGESVSVLTGNAVGARRPERVPRIVRVGLGLGLIYAGFLSALLLSMPRRLVECFTSSPPVLSVASILLVVVAGFQLGFVFYGICRAALRGTGDLRYTATVTIAAAWLCTPTLGYLFGQLCGFGVVGGWCGLCVEIVLASALYVARLERGRYRVALESPSEDDASRAASEAPELVNGELLGS